MSSRNSRTNPYIGPRAFRTGEVLYGRDRELAELLNLLIAERIVLLHSPSGAGKSSLVQAGLIPRLLEEGFQVLPVARVNHEPPQTYREQPGFNRYTFSALLSFDEALPEEQRLPLEQLARLSLKEYLDQRLALHQSETANQQTSGIENATALIFDQFEEVLTIAPTDQKGKATFFAQLGLALRDHKRWALFAMREDFIAALEPYLRPLPTRLRNTFRLDLLSVAAARQAIQSPPRQVGVNFNDAAANRLVDDLRMVQIQRPDGVMEPQPGLYVEPVQLQVVCYRLWQNLGESDREITSEDVARLGDVHRSLSEYYAERLAAIAQETGVSERSIREWFHKRLITEQGIRGQVLMGVEQSEGLENRVIRLLEDAHLVRAEKRRGATWFELAHDRLLRPVRTNNEAWFQAHLHLLQRQAALWRDEGRPDHLLLRQQVLEEAEKWAAENPQEMSEIDREFLQVCLQVRAREEQTRLAAERERQLKLETAEKVAEAERRRAEEQARAARKLQQRLFVAAAAAMVALFFALTAFYFGRQAQSTSNQNATLAVAAQSASTLAVGNAATAQANAATAQAASTQANAQKIIAESAQATAQAAYEIAVAQQATAEYNALVARTQANLARSRELSGLSLTYLESQPDLALLLSIEAYRKSDTAQALDALLRALQRSLSRQLEAFDQKIPKQPISIYAMVASADGRRLAWAGAGGLVRAWDFELRDLTLEKVLGNRETIRALAFSPDGKYLAAGNEAGEIFFLDSQSGGLVRYITSSLSAVTALAFSPDGSRLAYGGSAPNRETNLFVRSLDSNVLIDFIMRPLKYEITSIAWSPDSKYLASGSRERVLRIWDAGSGKELLAFEDFEGNVNSVAFSPNGQWLASGASDKTQPMDKNVLLWDLSLCLQSAANIQQQSVEVLQAPACKQQKPQAFIGLEGDVTNLTFSPDGLILVAGDHLGKTRLWDVRYREVLPQQPLQAGQAISGLTFSQVQDNILLATSSLDGSISLTTMKATDSLSGPGPTITGRVESLRFSTEGQVSAVDLGKAGLSLWHSGSDTELEQEGVLEMQPVLASLSWDGKSLAVLQEDEAGARVEIWGMGQTVPWFTLPAPQATAISSRQSAAGTIITETLTTSLGSVRSLAFSPDGSTLAAGVCRTRNEDLDLCTQNEIVLWRIASGGVLTSIPTQHTAAILSLAFSADGRLLASGGADGVIILHDLDQGGRQQGLPMIGQGSAVTALAFSADGNRLASGGSNSLLVLWNVASAQLIADPISGFSGVVTALAFNPDGTALVSGNDQGVLAWWRLKAWLDLACKYSQRNLSLIEWEQFLKDEPYQPTCSQFPGAQ